MVRRNYYIAAFKAKAASFFIKTDIRAREYPVAHMAQSFFIVVLS